MRRWSILILFVLAVLLAKPAHAQINPFLGEIDIVGFNFAPLGWAECDGSILAISQNAALFSLLGTYYGGDGRTTFALPDLRGRMVVGQGTSTLGSTYVMGQAGGAENITLTVAQLPPHTHPVMASDAPASELAPTSNVWASRPGAFMYSSAQSGFVPMNGMAVGTTGGGSPVSILPPFIVMNYIIALQGIYPPRS